MKQLIKKLIVPEGRKVRRLRGGLAKGMLMDLDLQSQSQRYWGLDEREILTPMRRLAKGCRTLVDVGANDGYYTMAFLKSSADRVVACEPGDVSDLLVLNAKRNGFALNDRFSLVARPIGTGTDCLSMTELLMKLPRPILVKVDIDGGEYDLLQSARDYPFLSETRWLIETHSSELEHQCVEWFRSRGHQTQIIYNARWRVVLPELRPIPHNRWFTASSHSQGASR